MFASNVGATNSVQNYTYVFYWMFFPNFGKTIDVLSKKFSLAFQIEVWLPQLPLAISGIWDKVECANLFFIAFLLQELINLTLWQKARFYTVLHFFT